MVYWYRYWDNRVDEYDCYVSGKKEYGKKGAWCEVYERLNGAYQIIWQ